MEPVEILTVLAVLGAGAALVYVAVNPPPAVGTSAPKTSPILPSPGTIPIIPSTPTPGIPGVVSVLSPTPAGAGTIVYNTMNWTRATGTIPAGSRVRVAIGSFDLDQILTQAKFQMSLAGFYALLGRWPGAGRDITIYGPSQKLPGDWPTDDPYPTTAWRAEYTTTTPVAVSDLPSIAYFWVAG